MRSAPFVLGLSCLLATAGCSEIAAPTGVGTPGPSASSQFSTEPKETDTTTVNKTPALSPSSVSPAPAKENPPRPVFNWAEAHWGFESARGQLGAWVNNQDCRSSAWLDLRIKKTGPRSLHIENRSPRSPHVWGTIAHDIAIKANQRYRISLWARANKLASNGAVSAIVDKEWKVRPIQLPKGTYDWAVFRGEFALPVDKITFRILSEDVGEAWIDGIKIEPVIEGKSTDRPARFDHAIALAELATCLQTTTKVAAAAGGQVRAEEGTTVRIEPGGLSADATLSIHKLKPKQPTAEPIAIYDITLSDGSRLVRPATITLPITAPDKIHSKKDVLIYHFDERKLDFEALEARVAADKKSVTFQTEHFSRFIEVEPSTWSVYVKQAMSERKSAYPLSVPYYWQSNSGWCWAASVAMIEGFEGFHRDIWQIPADPAFKNDFRTGAANANALADFLRREHAGWEVEANWFMGSSSLQGYLMYQLDQGHPVWVGLSFARHAVVVVGYNQDAVYVHDPSGQLVGYALGTAVADTAEIDHLAAVRIAWERWNTVALSSSWRVIGHNLRNKDDMEWHNGFLDGLNKFFNPMTAYFPNQTLVVKSPASKGRSISVQLISTQCDHESADYDYSFVITHQRPANPQEKDGRLHLEPVHFFWRGIEPPGYVFTHDLHEKSHVHAPGRLCNNDAIREIRPYVSNSVDGPRTDLVLNAFLDDEPLASNKVKMIKAKTVKQYYLLKDFSRRSAITSRKTVSGFDLSQEPLVPGKHTLRFQIGYNGQVFDESKIELEVSPAAVPGVQAEKRADGTVRLAWQAIPEERIAGCRIAYEVWQGMAESGTPVCTLPPGHYHFEYKPADSTQGFSVWARDLRSSLRSQDASLVWPAASSTDDLAIRGRFRLLKTTIVTYETKGKRKGDRLDMVATTTFSPVLLFPPETADQLIRRKQTDLNDKYKDYANGNWRKFLPNLPGYSDNSIPASWSIEIADAGPSDEPGKGGSKTEKKPGGGPKW